MAVVVQKYGGTSVGSVDRIRNVASRIIKYKERGDKVVVVVSAMSGETNRLIGLAHDITPAPHKREMDMLVSTGEQVSIALLAIALDSMGHEAVSMNANQVGIKTDSVFMNARIKHIETAPMQKELDAGKIVIVAGFQGIDEEGNITTLGRGGSDTSAVALAAALKADVCEIYTDVDGVYTADPNKVPDARLIKEICYEEMLELASLGAKVLHSRSVEIAMQYELVLHIRSSLNENEGTLVVKESNSMEKIAISGVTSKKDEARVTLFGVPDKPGIAADIFKMLADARVNVDIIVQTSTMSDINDISFTIKRDSLADVKKIVDQLKEREHASGVNIDEGIGIVSIVGVGMKSHHGIASTMFASLAEAGMNILMISTSEIKISVVIDEKRVDEAVKLLHKSFELDKA